jgi:hypothetical protein
MIVWDIETVPDLAGFAAANGHDGKTEDETPTELGDKFPKHTAFDLPVLRCRAMVHQLVLPRAPISNGTLTTLSICATLVQVFGDRT